MSPTPKRPARSATPSPTPARSAQPTRSATPTPSPDGIPLPTHGSDTTPKHALEAFVVGDGATKCVWLQDRYGERFAALWPPGYRARFGPLRIYDAKGRQVWQEGVERTLSGGPSPVHVDRIPPACRVGDMAWWLGPVG